MNIRVKWILYKKIRMCKKRIKLYENMPCDKSDAIKKELNLQLKILQETKWDKYLDCLIAIMQLTMIETEIQIIRSQPIKLAQI